MPSAILIATTRIDLPESAALVAQMADYYRSHDCEVQGGDGQARILVSIGHIELRSNKNGLDVEVGATTEVGVVQMKSAIIALLQGAAPDANFDCRWKGAGQSNGKLPNFRELTVGQITDLSPHMRRLRLHGPDLDAYDAEGIHVRLMIPPRGKANPKWPTLAENGMPVWPTGEDTVEQRVYTIRDMDADAGWIDVDFVMHGDNGPGSAFALHAAEGDLVAMTGPLGADLPDANWMLFAGDETALPAIGRYLHELPEYVGGHALIEVGSKANIIPLETKSRISVTWLLRENVEEITHSLIQDAIRAINIPKDSNKVYCWAGVEQADYKPIHAYWRKEIGLSRDDCVAMTFWRKTAA
ncbi:MULTISPECIES: siderophore-interacting protein [Thalassospira]|uniref:Siderophore-interacting protein n=2 Tax=Thalassospira TaxID=168934 RepID=A0A367WE87_9PROT|nr:MULTISPECIES: siderophore-interacting protein [Thalassospira]MDG4717660.1 siderophore-interacting protein [Thalassospira sp. FZY0004]RCK38881.1 siderophore-interacting protein [Thalassospira profundimaris]